MAGAIHLDCLFIDEGFGTLDPETLRTVSDAIRSMQVGGRMVGIITHVPELKEEFDQRIMVWKDGAVSKVTVGDADALGSSSTSVGFSNSEEPPLTSALPGRPGVRAGARRQGSVPAGDPARASG